MVAPVIAVLGGIFANPKTWLLINLLTNRMLRAIFVKVAKLTPEEVDAEIEKEEARKDELMDELDGH